VTVTLIAINLAVWVLYELPDVQHAADSFAYHPCEVEGACPVIGHGWLITAVTSMFLHADWMHLLGNMLFLWIFGNNVEDAFGPARFVAFYFAGGVAAIALQTFVTLQYGTDAASTIPNLGASGAISAVLGAYILLLPNAKVLTLILFIIPRELPAWIFLGFWFFLQAWQGGFSVQHPEQGGGVAFFAHIGGFAFGLLAVWVFRKRRPLRPAY
jgi:membrane associated rhomboid family serine protease